MRILMWFALGFAGAALTGTYLLPADWYFAAAGVCALALALCLGLLLRFPKARIAAMVIFGCGIGFVWQFCFEAAYLAPVRAADTQELFLSVSAVNYSEQTDYGGAAEGIVRLNGKPYKARIYLPEGTEVSPGDTLSGSFVLRGTLPGCSRDSAYYRGYGIFLLAYAHGTPTVSHGERLPLYGYPANIRRHVTDWINQIFHGDTAAFARALLLGDTTGIDYETDTALKVSGIRHIIAVSGLHVTILFSLIYVLTGKKRWPAALLGLPALLLFAAVAGFSPSITRACLMHTLMLLSMLADREYDPPTALAFAVIVMLAVNPWTATNVGFQLSVSCIVGIFLFSSRIRGWLLHPKRLGRWKGTAGKIAGFFSASVAVSISAVLLSTPLSAYYFGVVSLVSMLTNLVTLWMVTFVFYGILLGCVVSAVCAPVGAVVVWMAEWGIRYVLLTAKTLASFPLAAVYTESVYIVMWLILCYFLLAVYCRMGEKKPLILACCAVISLCVALMASWTEPLMDAFRMTVLDVGQGQCILLQSGGKNYLVDCGGDSDTAAADKAAGLLLSQGISRLDGMILTHYDADHAGGAVLLLSRIPADVLYLPNCADEAGTADALSARSDDLVLTVAEDMRITYGGTKITLIPSKGGISDNDSGLCVLFQAGDCDILITGDRSASGERELIASGTLPDLEVLVVGHHGSKTSTCRELLIKTRPEIAVISVGADNHYGHPADAVLERLAFYGCTVYRTDENGTIVYRG